MDSRYHRIEHDASAIETLLVELFLESYRKPPRQIILDLDVTDDLVYGNQEETFFNPYGEQITATSECGECKACGIASRREESINSLSSHTSHTTPGKGFTFS